MLSPRVLAIGVCLASAAATFALVVPNEVQLPGTQPNEVVAIQHVDSCTGCHGYYDAAIEPYRTWQGSMMAHASRDPLFWAALAVAEQDFDGVGDLCLRCHVPSGWLDGRSTPTDGSAFLPLDAEGVECMVCHRMTNPDQSEWDGVQNPPFIANSGGPNPEGWYGSGMMVLADGDTRYGPYGNPTAPHPWKKSNFHRSSELCGTCHDVSNPVVGDLAPNNGSIDPLPPGSFSGTPGTPLTTKAAFNNPPYSYGVVERTFSEHMASTLSATRVSDYQSLPIELRGGVLETVYNAALLAGQGGDYADGTERLYSCQSCHMTPAVAAGCNMLGSPVRGDMPVHDLTGGNTWAMDAIKWLDDRGLLQMGGGLNQWERASMDAAKLRARAMLAGAAALKVDKQAGVVQVVNRSGHKLFTGYPEGRRMWMNVRWYNLQNQLLREDGAYGDLPVNVGGRSLLVRSILDLQDPNLHIWHTTPGISQEWAAKLLTLGNDPATTLEYDRITGQPTFTLGQLAAMAPGSAHASFHFALNDTVLFDNRIPPWGLRYDDARTRNCLPMPETLYGNPGPGGEYQHWDEVQLSPPVGARKATFTLLYQSTSWEYVMSLVLGNDGTVSTLADTGLKLARAWYATGMAEPEVMAQVTATFP
ncbi:MAG: multiheme c-type cytochrome [Planctomycetota bacterium]|nr:multiheme c-type cytochrome [Planctomycetota bacterium]